MFRRSAHGPGHCAFFVLPLLGGCLVLGPDYQRPALAAQALCLETMTGKPVNEGAMYYATSKRRRVVPITVQLKADVAQTAQAIRQMLASGKLPAPLIGQPAAGQRHPACGG